MMIGFLVEVKAACVVMLSEIKLSGKCLSSTPLTNRVVC